MEEMTEKRLICFQDKKRPDMKLASIHGGIGAGIGAGKGLFSGAVKAPLMLTNGSSAPGAASAAARDASSAINKRPAQMAGGSLVVSITVHNSPI